jgi:hypothetical protein
MNTGCVKYIFLLSRGIAMSRLLFFFIALPSFVKGSVFDMPIAGRN